MRETVKKVTHEVDGKEMTFQIRKMDALRGSYLLKFVAEKLLPVLNGLQDVFTPIPEGASQDEVIKKRTDAVVTAIPMALAAISEEELINFETKCLNSVDVLMPAGWQKVMSGDNFGIDDVEYDMMTVLTLCYDVMEFNLAGFFGGKGLSSLLPRLNTSRQNA